MKSWRARVGSGLRFALLCMFCAVGASAQLYHFGKNKVQFDEFDWQRLETEHFDVYFYPEEAQLASFAGQMAEEGFRHLEQRHQRYPSTSRLPTIRVTSRLTSRPQARVEGVSQSIPNKIERHHR